jgi:hypothetical protein
MQPDTADFPIPKKVRFGGTANAPTPQFPETAGTAWPIPAAYPIVERRYNFAEKKPANPLIYLWRRFTMTKASAFVDKKSNGKFCFK